MATPKTKFGGKSLRETSLLESSASYSFSKSFFFAIFTIVTETECDWSGMSEGLQKFIGIREDCIFSLTPRTLTVIRLLTWQKFNHKYVKHYFPFFFIFYFFKSKNINYIFILQLSYTDDMASLIKNLSLLKRNSLTVNFFFF